jgi:hypothetical protein
MSNFDWDNEDTSEIDLIEEVNKQYADSIDEDDIPETMEDEPRTEPVKIPYKTVTERERSVIGEAMVRLEQARLYEMLIKHNLFEGIKANPTALKNVEKEIKEFIVQRLEILLGIKSEKTEKTETIHVVESSVKLPFNTVEVEFLKQLSYKGTQGASTNGDDVYLSTESSAREESVSVQNTVPKKMSETTRPTKPKGLAPINQAQTSTVKPSLKTKTPAKKEEPLRATSIQKPAKNVVPVSDVSKSIEEIAREDLKKMKNRKPASKMSSEELARANSQIATGVKAVPENPRPLPTAEQIASHYEMQQAMDSGRNDKSGFENVLARVLASKKGGSRIQQVD